MHHEVFKLCDMLECSALGHLEKKNILLPCNNGFPVTKKLLKNQCQLYCVQDGSNTWFHKDLSMNKKFSS